MKLYFSRHGESEANVLRVFSNREEAHGLTETGRQQAAALAEHLSEISFTGVYASPVLRAVETTRIVTARLGLDYTLSDALREFDVGALEGKTDEVYWQQHFDLIKAWVNGQDWDRGHPEGESLLDIQARFMPLIQELTRRYADSDANILLISHGGTLISMLPLLFNNVDHTFAWTHRIEYTADIEAVLCDGQWVCQRWGDTVFDL